MSKLLKQILVLILTITLLFSSFIGVYASDDDLPKSNTKDYALYAFAVYALSEGWTENAIAGTLSYMTAEGGGMGLYSYEAYWGKTGPDGKTNSTLIDNTAWLTWLGSSSTINTYREIYADMRERGKNVVEWAIGMGIFQWSDVVDGTRNATNFINAAKNSGKAWQDPNFQIPYAVEYIYSKSSDADYIDPRSFGGSAQEYAKRVTAFVGMPGWSWNDSAHASELQAHANFVKDAQNKIKDVKNNPGKYEAIFDISLNLSTYHDESLLGKFVGPFGNLKISDKYPIFSTNVAKEKRKQINEEIYTSIVDGVSTNDTKYSLYERFGSNLQFINYYGEASANITLFDHISTKYLHNDIKSLSIKEDILSFTSDYYLSAKAYVGREQVLTQQQLKSGYKDSRVKQYNTLNGGQVFVSYHSFLGKAIASGITEIVTWFLNGNFQTEMYNLLNTIVESDPWKTFQDGLFKILIPCIGLALMITVIRHVNLYRKGKSDLNILIRRILVCVMAMGIFGYSLYNPAQILNIGHKVTNFVDDIFKYSLNEVNQEDEVVAGSNYESTLEAYIWKTTIFNPWCQGVFGDKYENLYTQFEENKTDDEKLEQSHEDIEAIKENPDDKDHYDSASMTGDITIDVGNGTQIRNWAALAWSTQNKYHIDTSIAIDKETIKDSEIIKSFPNALTTVDGNYYADTFRWIDAKLDISPIYNLRGGTISKIINYPTSKEWKTSYLSASRTMLWKSFLLLGLVPILVKKLVAYFKILFQAFKGIWYGLWEIFKENEGLSGWWQDTKDSILKYFYYSAQLYILIILFKKFVGSDNFILNIAYLVICFAMTFVSIEEFSSKVYELKRRKRRLIGA